MQTIQSNKKSIFKDGTFIVSLISSLILLSVSLIINYFASVYATARASNPVTDIILNNIRTFDVDGFFVYGGIFLVILIIIFCFTNVKQAPFILKSISLFIVVRSVFITLTHIGVFPTQALLDSNHIGNRFFFAGDLFFSGHTGLPFLFALMYWQNIKIRIFFLLLSVFFGIIVLLGHFHYSIDVLSAFFITYSIFHLSIFFFPKDYILFKNSARKAFKIL